MEYRIDVINTFISTHIEQSYLTVMSLKPSNVHFSTDIGSPYTPIAILIYIQFSYPLVKAETFFTEYTILFNNFKKYSSSKDQNMRLCVPSLLFEGI